MTRSGIDPAFEPDRPSSDRWADRAQDTAGNERSQTTEAAYAGLARDVVARLAETRAAVTAQGGKPKQDSRDFASDRTLIVDRICAALLSGREDDAQEIIRAEMAAGLPADQVYELLLIQACRRLGEMWEEDDVTFFKMTVAIGAVYGLLRWMRSIAATARNGGAGTDITVCFASVPGEKHTIGISIAAERLRLRGWDIDVHVDRTHQTLVELIGEGNYAVVAVSAATALHLAALTRLVGDLRAVRAECRLVLCGRILQEVDDLPVRLNAPAVMDQGSDAIEEMNALLTAAAAKWRARHGPMAGVPYSNGRG